MCHKCETSHMLSRLNTISRDRYVPADNTELENLLRQLREETNQTEEIVEENPFG